MFFGGGGGFPDGFPGGFPGGAGRRGGRADVDNESLYKVLGLEKTCTAGTTCVIFYFVFPTHILTGCLHVDHEPAVLGANV